MYMYIYIYTHTHNSDVEVIPQYSPKESIIDKIIKVEQLIRAESSKPLLTKTEKRNES